MTAVWCDPSQLFTLPCGCVARQADFGGQWHPLRACLAHFTPGAYAPMVRCRCCGEYLMAVACHCEPTWCPRCGGADGKCAHHCECDRDPETGRLLELDPWADGHPEP